ncbi:hypothetical protein J057_11801 [Marinobacter nanhaiticus D15-8W]|uniref:Uncharacterized protein n=1 Tax=Marinobacter nanhaiticus D15-8W TaxID=626887 RepID=N6W0H7_9GAMM|nr:hypothetical protein J057_11801 [Marinobacter nanhaiticus D15-8W]
MHRFRFCLLLSVWQGQNARPDPGLVHESLVQDGGDMIYALVLLLLLRAVDFPIFRVSTFFEK